jgi:exosome complex component RRP40
MESHIVCPTDTPIGIHSNLALSKVTTIGIMTMSPSPFVGHLNTFYHPVKGQIVIGIIERRVNEDWHVDIGYSHSALLPQLAFDGATKKNCPKFLRGDAVAAYVEDVPEAGETLLSCVPRSRHETFGQLSGGMIIRARPHDLEQLERGEFIAEIAAHSITLRVAWGKNGRAFLDTGNAVLTVQLAQALLDALRSESPADAFRESVANLDLSGV